MHAIGARLRALYDAKAVIFIHSLYDVEVVIFILLSRKKCYRCRAIMENYAKVVVFIPLSRKKKKLLLPSDHETKLRSWNQWLH